MNKYNLMVTNRTIQEYRPESKWESRRRIRREMRYLFPAHESFVEVVETLAWFLLAGLLIVSAVAFPVMFARWWLCL